jgi:F0F1-type ATP synthase membrane subunit b/b'
MLNVLCFDSWNSQEPLRDQLDRAKTARVRMEAENKLIIQQLEEVKAQSKEIVNQWKGKQSPFPTCNTVE